MPAPYAQFGPNVEELFDDPMLTVACVLLVLVSVGWILVSRLVVRNLRRAALRRIEDPNVDEVRPVEDASGARR